jgi:hypothetical protein
MRPGTATTTGRSRARAYDALLDRARAERDPASGSRSSREAERVLVEEELPMIPIFHYVSHVHVRPRADHGMSAHPRTKQNLFLIDVLGDGIGADEPRPMRRRVADPGAGGGCRGGPGSGSIRVACCSSR